MVITSTEVYLFMLLVVDSDCDMNVLLVTAFELDRKNHMLSEWQSILNRVIESHAKWVTKYT